MSETKIYEIECKKAQLTFTNKRLRYKKKGATLASIFGVLGTAVQQAYSGINKLDLPYDQLGQLIIKKSKDNATITIQILGASGTFTLQDIEISPQQAEQLFQTLRPMPELQGKIRIETQL